MLQALCTPCRCTHGSRDCRCGTIGAKLVERLDSLVAERGLQGSVGVFRCSHVGGHKVLHLYSLHHTYWTS